MFKNKNISDNQKKLLIWPVLLTLLILVGLGLAGCDVYNGYPTAVPVTATPASTTPAATPTATSQPTYPPLPTSTPRPTLPPAPSNVTLKKQDILQRAFSALLNQYYVPLNSADVYEVGLDGVRDALIDAGVKQPDVPIPPFNGNAQQDFQSFIQAFTITVGKYSSNLSEDKMAYAAIKNTTSTLADCTPPQTAFYTPDLAQAYLRNRLGQIEYTGIGVNLLPFDNTSGHYITNVISGTPAEQAGLKVGDAVIAINGQNVTNLDSTALVGLIQRNSGSKITLTVRRAKTNQQENVDVSRQTVQIPVVESKTLPDNIAYLHFNSFPLALDDATFNQYVSRFDSLIRDFTSKGVKGYVLDLRGTRYGYLRLVQSLVSRFVSGPDLVTLVGRDQQGQRNVVQVPSLSNVQAVNTPVAVLVDQSTGNEAEIFALAIQNKRKGSVFGQPTAGCPVASIPFQLSDNSVLNVSIYRSIEDSSDPNSWVADITPDVAVSLDQQSLSQGLDAQLEKAVAFIKS